MKKPEMTTPDWSAIFNIPPTDPPSLQPIAGASFFDNVNWPTVILCAAIVVVGVGFLYWVNKKQNKRMIALVSQNKFNENRIPSVSAFIASIEKNNNEINEPD